MLSNRLRFTLPSEQSSNLDSFISGVRKPSRAVDSRPTTKVFLYTYMRGGSTFLGQIFNWNPQAMYWYEVADSYFVAKFGMPVWHLPYYLKHFPNGTVR